MKLWIISDLHLEFGLFPFWPTLPDADVCVAAGDIHNPGARAIEWLAETIAPRMPVVFVLGNHEFYGGGTYREVIVDSLLAARRHPRVHLLDDGAVVIDGVRFFGTTLWTDYALGAPDDSGPARDRAIMRAMSEASGQVADHRQIRLSGSPERDKMIARSLRREAGPGFDIRSAWELAGELMGLWTPYAARDAHVASRAFLEGAAAEPHDGPTVVVTHHAPHPDCVGKAFEGSPLNPSFVSDLRSVIHLLEPRLWIHGHVHHNVDLVDGRSDTRIICNPRGYNGENAGFVPDLVVEVS